MNAIRFTILGQPASKSNTSQIVKLGDRVSITKSKVAKAYERGALRQIPIPARQRLEGPLRVSIRIWYADERSDLDESLILDCLQDRWQKNPQPSIDAGLGTRHLVQAGVYRNDRQVREKHVFHGIDRNNPRAEIVVEALQAQQPALDLREPMEIF